jgi:hypothetical protein
MTNKQNKMKTKKTEKELGNDVIKDEGNYI